MLVQDVGLDEGRGEEYWNGLLEGGQRAGLRVQGAHAWRLPAGVCLQDCRRAQYHLW
jgi:hypothetical protein